MPSAGSVAGAAAPIQPIEEWREDQGKAVWVVDKSAGNPKNKALAEYTMAEVAKHNKPDDLWLVIKGNVYDVSKWAKYHPGGHLCLENLAGHDCTDAFENYHPLYVYNERLPNFLKGRIKAASAPAATRDASLIADFRALRQRLLKEKKYETRYSFYLFTGLWIAALFAVALYFSLGNTFASRMLGAVVMGCFWQQLAFCGHDLGHNGVTHVRAVDNLIGIIAGNVLGGVSLGWWKWSHNVHHVVTNSVEHDPDIQHLPVFAVTDKIFKRFYSTFHAKWMVFDSPAQFLVAYQHYLYYPIMGLARINLYLQSFILLLSHEQWQFKKLEWFALAGFWAWYGALLYSMGSVGQAVAYLLLAHAVSGVLHVQITLSHFSMDTYNGRPAYELEEECWVRKQLATSMNVTCPAWMDWFHGGLQFQIEHHLFPRLPRHNSRYASKLVRELCKKHGVRYHSVGFVQANREIVAALYKAAMQARAVPGKATFLKSMLWDGMNAKG